MTKYGAIDLGGYPLYYAKLKSEQCIGFKWKFIYICIKALGKIKPGDFELLTDSDYIHKTYLFILFDYCYNNHPIIDLTFNPDVVFTDEHKTHLLLSLIERRILELKEIDFLMTENSVKKFQFKVASLVDGLIV